MRRRLSSVAPYRFSNTTAPPPVECGEDVSAPPVPETPSACGKPELFRTAQGANRLDNGRWISARFILIRLSTEALLPDMPFTRSVSRTDIRWRMPADSTHRSSKPAEDETHVSAALLPNPHALPPEASMNLRLATTRPARTCTR